MSMERLVHHTNPEARPTPMLVLSALREIDREIELVYAGDQLWWLGSVRANSERRRAGEVILSQLARLDDHLKDRPSVARSIMLGKLALQGFALIESYRDHGDPSGVVTVAFDTPLAYETTILDDFRARDEAWRRDQGAGVVAERYGITRGNEREARAAAQFDAYLATDARDHYRRELRGRTTFGYGGMTGGGGHSLIVSPY